MMADRIEDGGAAFPFAFRDTEGHPLEHRAFGMSLRDYFAIHATQPGMAEIASMAGLTYGANQIWSDPQTSIGTFDAWWRDLPQSERFYLCAKVRYAEADAMLVARSRQMGVNVGGAA